jgi:predicted ATP-grasp superfamily ATP-dependent carboligase
MERHLLVGLSTRAIAESAVKSGDDILTLDHFGDQDQKMLVKNLSLARDCGLPFSAANLLRASETLEFDRVTYTSNLENHPEVVAVLACRAKLAGNSSQTIRRIRDWKLLREFCRNKSVKHPVTLLPGEEEQATSDHAWLVKPVDGGGGHHIYPWDGRPLSDSSILQAYAEGIPFSAAFVANGSRGVVLGLTRQLNGISELGVDGYNWCGNILPLTLAADQKKRLLREIQHLVNDLIQHFELKGVGGIDFILAESGDGQLSPFLLEVNPRYTGSMELIEWAYGLNIYSLHRDACDGHLPEFTLSEQVDEAYYGKGIVFARQDVVIKNTESWFSSGRRDVPFAGDRIKQGHPVCTILAQADTDNDCLANLFVDADKLRLEVSDIRR